MSKSDFKFFRGLDLDGGDIYRLQGSIDHIKRIAALDPEAKAFNTLGYVKTSKADINAADLKPSQYYQSGDGVYVKKEYLTNDNVHSDKIIRIKPLCNWCTTAEFVRTWGLMSDSVKSIEEANKPGARFIYKNKDGVSIELVDSDDVDFWTIVNYPSSPDVYDKSKTIVFQAEPSCKAANVPWGVHSWGIWAEPNETEFLAVHGRNQDVLNVGQSELELTKFELENLDENQPRLDVVSSMCSSKFFDPGHILRVNFLRYLEEKGGVKLNIYSYDNGLGFKNFRGPLYKFQNKSKGYLPYKYYFMAENNSEENFVTEKIWEPILCECLVFYWGCPNIERWIDERAYVKLDFNDFPASYELIKRAIAEDWWSQRLPYIRAEKAKILEQYMFLPLAAKYVN